MRFIVTSRTEFFDVKYKNIIDEQLVEKHETIEMFYDLFEDLQKNLEQKDDMLEIHAENNKRILEFYRHIKGELGIKD